MSKKDDFEHILMLSGGFSEQAATSNKIWIILLLVSVLSIMPIPTKEDLKTPGTVEQKIDLPFDLGKVNSLDYYPFSMLLISILIIGFSSAHILAMRTRHLIQIAIDKCKDKFLNGIHIQDIVDNTICSTFSRISPIAQTIRGVNQFKTFPPKGSWIKHLSNILYIILSIASYIIVYLFPSFGLVNSIIKTNEVVNQTNFWGIPFYLFWIFGTLSIFALFVAFITDIIYKIRGIRNSYQNR